MSESEKNIAVSRRILLSEAIEELDQQISVLGDHTSSLTTRLLPALLPTTLSEGRVSEVPTDEMSDLTRRLVEKVERLRILNWQLEALADGVDL